MAVAYYMVNPQEPYTGTNITGKPNYAFNPYLEAGFGPSVLNNTLSSVKSKTGVITPTYVGVRTNCMSCHAMAAIILANPLDSNPPYIGNAYVSLNDPMFKGQLKLDFGWSIQGNIDTTGLAQYCKNHGCK